MKKSALFLIGFALFLGSAAQAAVTSKDVVVSVSDVFVPGGFDTGSDVFVVESGIFPNGCYSWKEARVNHVKENVHEIETMATVQQGMCIMVLVPFTKEVRLGQFSRGEHTLRFINGDGTYLEKTLVIE